MSHKTYKVKEAYVTIQGEGYQSGLPAVFCRFTGCNLWSGHENSRSRAICQFCDTDFIGTDGLNGGRFSGPDSLSAHLKKLWLSSAPNMGNALIVFTGGEPALQLDDELIDACKALGFRTAVETNGTLRLPEGLDWVCVSPKANETLVIRKGDELKLVFPQHENTPRDFESLDFKHFYLQPLDGENTALNTQNAVSYCMKNPQWRLSLQTHKLIGIN